VREPFGRPPSELRGRPPPSPSPVPPSGALASSHSTVMLPSPLLLAAITHMGTGQAGTTVASARGCAPVLNAATAAAAALPLTSRVAASPYTQAGLRGDLGPLRAQGSGPSGAHGRTSPMLDTLMGEMLGGAGRHGGAFYSDGLFAVLTSMFTFAPSF